MTPKLHLLINSKCLTSTLTWEPTGFFKWTFQIWKVTLPASCQGTYRLWEPIGFQEDSFRTTYLLLSFQREPQKSMGIGYLGEILHGFLTSFMLKWTYILISLSGNFLWHLIFLSSPKLSTIQQLHTHTHTLSISVITIRDDLKSKK